MSSFVSTNRFCGGVENSGLEIKDIENIFINERGDKMRGNLDMNGNKIINVSNPIENNEVVNRGFLQNFIDEQLKIFQKEVINKENKQIIELKNSIDQTTTNQNGVITTMSNVMKKSEDQIKSITSTLEKMQTTFEKKNTLTVEEVLNILKNSIGKSSFFESVERQKN